MDVGGILKACRQRSGKSQEELADELYINQSDVSKYESGTKEPTINIFYEWTANTQTQEVVVAFLTGVDGVGIMQQLIDSGITAIGAILLGGIM